MPLHKLTLAPGINRESTNYGNEGGWYDCDKIRFRSGNPEKIGGWTRLSSSTYLGITRSLWDWVGFTGTNYLGVGTTTRYYIEVGGSFANVTPIVRTSTNLGAAPGPFTVSVGSATVTITDSTYDPGVGDYISITGAVSLGGNITAAILNQEHSVVSVNTLANTYTITVPVLAAAGDTLHGGAVVVVNYEYPVGSNVSSVGTGWGMGPWGGAPSRGWGDPYYTSVVSQLRQWTTDNYGQDLVIAARGGGIYYWAATTIPITTRATLLSTLSTAAGKAGTYVPSATNQVLASAIQRFVIVFGANPYISGTPGSTFDPMLVRWSDQADHLQWVPSITNQAGEFRLTHGSEIVTALVTREENLIWTDSALYSMQYLGPPYVWGFNIRADNTSIISSNAAITANNITYWMGTDKFYAYTGRVETLVCTVKQYVYENINLDQGAQVFAGGNSGYNEVWWFYCSGSSNTIDKYVIYNYLDNVWYTGNMARTAWLDVGTRPFPIAADYNNRLLYHESSVDDNSGLSPVAINAYIQSSDFDIADGHNFGFVWRMLPDVNFNGSDVNNPYVNISIVPRRNAGAAYGTADVPTVTSGDDYSLPYPPNSSVYIVQHFTGQVYTRLRGRQMSFRIESNSLGVAWQLGATRWDVRPDGRR